MDMLKAKLPDLENRRWYFASIDHATHRPKGGACSDKEPATTWQVAEKSYPGSRIKPATGSDVPEENPELPGFVKRPQFPAQWGTDGDPSWGGVFEQKVLERGGAFRKSQEERAESNAIIERWIQELESGAAVLMLHAGCVGDFRRLWSRACHVFEYNYEKKHVLKSGPFEWMAPFKATWGVDYKGDLLTFGCSCSYLARTDGVLGRDKFDPRGTPGIFVDYKTEGAVEVIDLKTLREEKTIRTVVTRDFQADTQVFPLRDITMKRWFLSLSLSRRMPSACSCGTMPRRVRPTRAGECRQRCVGSASTSSATTSACAWSASHRP